MSRQDFARRIDDTFQKAWLAPGLTLGTRLGLFNGLAKLAPTKSEAVTVKQLAQELDMRERYIREWINSMASADVVDHYEIDGVDRYWLAPHKHSSLVTEGGGMCGASALEIFIGAVAAFGEVEKCFRNGGPTGTDVDSYPILHDFLSRKGEATFCHEDQIPALLMNDEEVMKRLEAGMRVIELGCGAAGPTRLLAKKYPNSSFVASELSESVLERAKEKCKDVENISYQVIDACAVPDSLSGKFDLVILCDVFHDVAYPEKLLQGVLKLLSSGGRFLMLDIDMLGTVAENKQRDASSSAFMYSISTLYCVPTSLYHPNGAGLGACVGAPRLEKMLRESGFTEVHKAVGDYGLTFICSK